MKEFDLTLEREMNDWDIINGDIEWQDILVVDESDALVLCSDWEL